MEALETVAQQESCALPTAAEPDFELGGCDVIRSPGEEVALLLAVVTFQPREGAGARAWEPSRQPCQRLGVFENCSFEDQGKGLGIVVGNGALVG